MMTKASILPAKIGKEQVAAVYKSKAAVYDIWGKLTESKAQERCLEIANLQDGETILEVAVGTGLTFQRILEQNPTGFTEGMDLTEAMLAKARSKASAIGHQNYRLQVGDAYDLAFEDGRFDLLINNYMFDLLPETDFVPILAEFKRVLRPGGRLVLLNMARGDHWYNHIWDAIYRLQPSWMGGCRSVAMLSYVETVGFEDIYYETHSQMTFPSELIYAENPE